MLHQYLKIIIPVLAIAATIIAPTPAAAQDTVMFNYQGRVKVHGHEFNGDGQFKFAILSPNKKSTLWSSDGTSIDGSEPTTGITLPVTDGVFNVVMGTNGIMKPINSTIFQTKRPLKLRTWFDDGIHGFQLLTPDHNLINVSLITSETSGEAFTIYVNGQIGDDSNSGLKPEEAKKTIQAAVDIVPGRVMTDVTIDIADGTYPEEVLLFGISVKPGKELRLLGDEDWRPNSGGEPSVVITGADGNTPGVRNFGMRAVLCNGIEVNGLAFVDAAKQGINLSKCDFQINNCLASRNGGNGINISNQTYATLHSCMSTSSGAHGIGINTNSRAPMTNCSSLRNGHSGLAVMDNSTSPQDGTCEYSFNQFHGILCIGNSSVGASYEYEGFIHDNNGYGIVAGWDAAYTNFTNTTTIYGNASGQELSFFDGHLDW